MSDETKAESSESKAVGRVKSALPTVFAMLREAKKTGEPRGAIIGMRPDKSGQIVGSFDMQAMMEDIAAIVGYVSDPEEEDLDYKADKILAGVAQGKIVL